ncbi:MULTISPECIES: hypothetical protein [Pseudoalteromonas]|uniref:hypothetical protein n=1 Tax=Pseudoalteromonas TaxID=53246 RepID=UPI0015842A28|nr:MULTISPECIES: hypothetical protein [Pseudoalteromonas]MDI4651961.1 hypothetical protein [Pseudoalteromonas shioyasakiensis]NUJ38289.1 hypothetical protein [Pseudoalteromonas sp. 0303]
MLVISTVLLLCACWVLPVCAGTIYSQFPTEIDPHGHYVFYSHGFIVEGTNPKPVHKTFGVYDFIAVKEALTDESYHLIDRSDVTKFEEISINTGLSHGAFYKPKDEWLLPIKKWLKD